MLQQHAQEVLDLRDLARLAQAGRLGRLQAAAQHADGFGALGEGEEGGGDEFGGPELVGRGGGRGWEGGDQVGEEVEDVGVGAGFVEQTGQFGAAALVQRGSAADVVLDVGVEGLPGCDDVGRGDVGERVVADAEAGVVVRGEFLVEGVTEDEEERVENVLVRTVVVHEPGPGDEWVLVVLVELAGAVLQVAEEDVGQVPGGEASVFSEEPEEIAEEDGIVFSQGGHYVRAGTVHVGDGVVAVCAQVAV